MVSAGSIPALDFRNNNFNRKGFAMKFSRIIFSEFFNKVNAIITIAGTMYGVEHVSFKSESEMIGGLERFTCYITIKFDIRSCKIIAYVENNSTVSPNFEAVIQGKTYMGYREVINGLTEITC